MINSQFYFKIAALLYALSLSASFLPGALHNIYRPVLMISFAMNGFCVLLKYYMVFPMLPMYLGPLALPFVLAGIILFFRCRIQKDIKAVRILLSMIVIIATAAVLFPKDFYLPFIKSRSLPAHLFFLFGVAGRACFLVAATWAILWLFYHKNLKRENINIENINCKEVILPQGKDTVSKEGVPAEHHPKKPLRSCLSGSGCIPFHLLGTTSTCWTVWGFFFLTLSMFTGELWSYLGWGTPVVWDDPAITTTMATWFFYICWLHLHLTGFWTAARRQGFAALGAVVVFFLMLIPELGPLRWPF